MDLAIIGGSQSTGSSLLRQVLNRHDALYCMNESHIFCKPSLYQSFETNLSALLKRGRSGLVSAGWHVFHGIELDKEQRSELMQIVRDSNFSDVQSFFQGLVRITPKENIRYLLDKTPANTFTSQQFLSLDPGNKCILTIRDPYDICASLINRGRSILDAVVLVKSSFAAMNALIGSERVFVVQYESLTARPAETIKELCAFLDIPFQEKMLEEGNTFKESDTKIEGWNFDETAVISRNKVRRFDTMNPELKQKVIHAFDVITWNSDDKACRQLMEKMDYDYQKPLGNSKNQLRIELLKSLSIKTVRNHTYHLFNNPVQLKR